MKSKELVAYSAAFAGPLAGNAVLALLDTFEGEWQVSSTTILLAIPAFMFPFATIQLFSGTISDAYNRRNTMVFGFLIYAVGGFLAALSSSFGFFMITRFVQGIGFAFVQPVLLATLSEISTPERLGLVMGYYGSSTTAGVALGPLLAGFLAEVNWRWAFVLIGSLGIAVMLSMLAVFPAEPRRSSGRISASSIGRQLLSAARRADVVRLSAVGFIAFLSFVGVMAFVANELGSGPLHLRPSEIGIAVSANGAAGIAFSPLSGRLVDRKGTRISVIIGFATAGLGALILAFSTRYEQFIASMAIQGTGTSFVWSALLTMIVRAHPSLRGTASSVFNSSRFFGYALAPVALAPILVSSGFASLMILCSFLCLIALVLALVTSSSLDRG